MTFCILDITASNFQKKAQKGPQAVLCPKNSEDGGQRSRSKGNQGSRRRFLAMIFAGWVWAADSLLSLTPWQWFAQNLGVWTTGHCRYLAARRMTAVWPGMKPSQVWLYLRWTTQGRCFCSYCYDVNILEMRRLQLVCSSNSYLEWFAFRDCRCKL